MGPLEPANESSRAAANKQKRQSISELVSSFGITRSPPPSVKPRQPSIEQWSPTPQKAQINPSSQSLFTDATGTRDLAATDLYNGVPSLFGKDSGRSMNQNWTNDLGPVSTNESGANTNPPCIDLTYAENDPADDLPQLFLAGKSYSSPIYIVDETDESDLNTLAETGNAVSTPNLSVDEEEAYVGEDKVDNAQKSPIIDISDTEQVPYTPTRTLPASPSTPSYLLSCMQGEDASVYDVGTPDSPSLRRSQRPKNTPKTYSVRKLTFPGVSPRRTTKEPKFQISSDLQSSPLRSPVKPPSARKQVREEIAKVTKVKRDRFLKQYEELFLPLLPEQNYVARLESQSKIVDYVQLAGQPSGVTATLKPHQIILGDEMGLGKTLQTLSLFSWVEEHCQTQDAENRPYLVVCPLSVLSSWVSEAKRWTPSLKVLSLHGGKAERQHLKRLAAGHDRKLSSNEEDHKIIVTTYDTFVAEQAWFKTAFVWRYVVLDEGHILKNSKTQVAKTFQSISTEFRLMLTGTPLQNDLAELWSILHWLLPDVFCAKSKNLFKKSFNLAKGSVDMSVMNDSRKLLELLMLRRLKNSPDVNLGLPPKTEVLLYVPLTPMQRDFYMHLITHQGDLFLNEVFADTKDKENPSGLKSPLPASTPPRSEGGINEKKDNSGEFQRLMNLVMQLRKCCNHPYLLPNVEPDPYQLGHHVIQSSGKFIVLEKVLRELVLVRKRKVLIFSGFTGMLDLTEDLITILDAFKSLRIDGQCGRARRSLMMRLFNDPRAEISVMLISTRAGGLGITLTAATEVIFLDQDWNPQVTLQAEARAHRIGQKNPVTIYKLCTQGTVEEQMMGRLEKKLYLSAKITESMKSLHNAAECSQSTAEAPQLGTTQLKSLLRRGAQTLTTPITDVADMASWDFEQILARCKPVDPAIAEAEVDEEGWLNTMERVETAVFDGRRIEHEKGEKGWTDAPVNLELDRTQRRTGKNTTVEIDGFLVSKESLECGDWEAVPTMAGKDPSLASPKRQKKAPMRNQPYCQVCWDDGEMIKCSICPRSYHRDCLEDDPAKSSVFKGQYICPQHRCLVCSGKSSEVGGLLYRCRFCTAAFCEGCLEFDHVQLLDFAIPEFEILDYGANPTVFFIKCRACCDLNFAAPDLKAYSASQMKKWEMTWEDFRKRQQPPQAAKLERKDSMNLLSCSASQEDDGPTQSTSLADHLNDTTEPSTSWSTPCRSPAKRDASFDFSLTPQDPTERLKGGPSPPKKLKFGN
ncbi:SNF2 family N-terminal domain-containing protein [Phyllosticta citricarpa]|uniref:SNF2 family N-terminal domain-containing protein n=1 Tax=Phyllosticta citricarpa TaxID=55181 RepID=A0ABR1M6B4_9PEZI